jgi:hypothetical protein
MPTIIFLLFAWLVGAAHVQMYMTGQGILISSAVAADRWSQVCQYYKPGQIVKRRFPLKYKCEIRMKV